MNEETLTQLKIIIERVVRPIQASGARKRRMREELLDYAMMVFEEESGDGVEASVALDRVRQRFGDAASVSRELQSAVGQRERLQWWLENLLRFRPGEPAIRRATRHAFLIFAAISAEMLAFLVPLILLAKADAYHDRFRGPSFLVTMLCVVPAVFFVFTLLVHGLRQALFLGNRRSLLRGCVMLALAPLTIFLAVFILSFGVLSDGWRCFNDPLLFRNAAILGALSHAGLLAFASQTSKEIRYAQEWQSLQIDE